MTKQEFLDNLRLALGGKISAAQIQEHIDYYEEYINTEVRKGREEQEVLKMLGDPRLIARTITRTADIREEQTGEYGEGAYSSGREMRAQSENRQLKRLSGLPGWVWILLGLLIVVVVLGAAFSLVSALFPVAFPVLIILFIVKLIRNKRS